METEGSASDSHIRVPALFGETFQRSKTPEIGKAPFVHSNENDRTILESFRCMNRENMDSRSFHSVPAA